MVYRNVFVSFSGRSTGEGLCQAGCRHPQRRRRRRQTLPRERRQRDLALRGRPLHRRRRRQRRRRQTRGLALVTGRRGDRRERGSRRLVRRRSQRRVRPFELVGRDLVSRRRPLLQVGRHRFGQASFQICRHRS